MRRRGPLATPAEQCTAPCPIARVMDVADSAWRDSLRGVTIADVATDVGRTTPPDTLERAREWLQS